MGGGVSRPTVNEAFPNPVENDLRVVYFGGGLRVPITGGLTVFGDARVMMALEGADGILGVWPVRAGASGGASKPVHFHARDPLAVVSEPR